MFLVLPTFATGNKTHKKLFANESNNNIQQVYKIVHSTR